LYAIIMQGTPSTVRELKKLYAPNKSKERMLRDNLISYLKLGKDSRLKGFDGLTSVLDDCCLTPNKVHTEWRAFYDDWFDYTLTAHVVESFKKDDHHRGFIMRALKGTFSGLCETLELRELESYLGPVKLVDLEVDFYARFTEKNENTRVDIGVLHIRRYSVANQLNMTKLRNGFERGHLTLGILVVPALNGSSPTLLNNFNNMRLPLYLSDYDTISKLTVLFNKEGGALVDPGRLY